MSDLCYLGKNWFAMLQLTHKWRIHKFLTPLQYEHDYTDSGMFPDQTTADASDGCRNPASGLNPIAADQTAPWCFTTSSQQEWEHCHQLPLCDCK